MSFAAISSPRCKRQRGFFRKTLELNYDEMIVQHPLLGRYDVPGLLRFMSAHEERHQSQIVSIQTSSFSPESTRCCGARYA